MLINRHNYEEYFLLYVDDELTAQQKNLVEEFVEQNTDLKKEFDLLLQTKLTNINELLYEEKNSLFRSETTSVNLNNYQENFLLYADNELSITEKEAIEKFVLQNPQTQQLFSEIKSTVLHNEKIIFPDKQSLYRRKATPVFWINRISVAAAVLLLAVLVWLLNPTDTGKKIDTASVNTQKVEQENAITKQQNTTTIISNNTQSPKEKSINTSNHLAVQKNDQVTAKTVITKDTIQNNNTTKYNNTIEVVQQQTTIKNNISNNDNNNVIPIRKEETVIAANATTKNTEVVTNVQPVTYKLLDTSDETIEQNNSTNNTEDAKVYIGGFKVSKSKISNFLGKAKKAILKQQENSYTVTL